MRILALAILVLGAAASAKEPSKADLDEARRHFKAGEAQFRAGDFDRAVEEYQLAYRLVDRPGLLFNIGSAYRRKAESTGAVDDKKRALDFYQRYVDAEPTGKAVDDAKSFIATLRDQIAAESPKPLEPSPPEPPPSPPPPPARQSPSPPQPRPPAQPPSPPRSPPSDSGRPFRIAGLVSAAVGVALVGTGVYFGLKARSTATDVDGLKDQWDPSLDASGAAASRNALILIGAGSAAIAGGAILTFVLGRHDDAALSIAPAPTTGGGAIVLGGRF